MGMRLLEGINEWWMGEACCATTVKRGEQG